MNYFLWSHAEGSLPCSVKAHVWSLMLKLHHCRYCLLRSLLLRLLNYYPQFRLELMCQSSDTECLVEPVSTP